MSASDNPTTVVPAIGIVCRLQPGEACPNCGAVGATTDQADNGLNDTWAGDPMPVCGKWKERQP
jgi:hypothetical protein